ncbi:tRNA wybutosine-synthesizing protein 1 [[Emmonsia] crescens]|uniref:tRNA 4-demethylwyosine synthase (AdoMet-dependent) n=1 Tax=[Emmonsia] crescens TaxID=73230 RepID=A0A2B7Z9Y4_9EURO|nr:tRNA wybutosine-synthesizing protein 1 [Emmonsia crescens]
MAGDALGIAAQGLFSLWHRYRVPILFLAPVVFAVVQLFPRNPKPDTPSPASLSPSQKNKQTRDAKSDEREVESLSRNDSLAAAQPKGDSSRSSSADSSNKRAKQPSNGPKRVHGTKPAKNGAKNRTNPEGLAQDIAIQPLVFYASLTASTETYAKSFCDRLQQTALPLPENSKGTILTPELHDLSYIELDDYFITAPKPPDSAPNTRFFYCILIPTYNIDTMINTFLGHLDETHNDFRIDTSALSELAGYSVFGFGDREGWPTEEEGFCSQAKEVDRWMAKLTGKKRAYPLGMVDVKGGNIQKVLSEWCDGLRDVMFDLMASGGLGEGVPGSGDPVESDEEEIDDDDEENDENSENSRKKGRKEQIVDLEDIKFGVSNDKKTSTDPQLLPIDFTTQSRAQPAKPAPQLEMVPTSSPTYAALTKQGYTIVGSHSGVKICRWTKSALRGRGSCYKNSFYGIKSHLCMETTPSLSCSNKCVFCWRHGTNPVGTTWRWKVDPPDLIFDGVKTGHYKKIKMLRGVPGVRAERFAEAMRIRHCALSLVGEPIFYPHINEFLALLHNEHISSFLVCNAQHPDELAALHRVTQLYVSIDASNRESLRKIDRPLHRDFWERFQRCLDILREKRYLQRTVYRLTLVKGFNVDEEAVGYADLVEKGLPCFVEVKGVTFCGTSTSASAGLTMQNVPFYEEVVTFVVALNAELVRRGLGYGIAAEHKHSCCVLLASNRFYVNDRWHTRIDYDKFFTLLEKEKSDGIPFRPEDYMRETEEWALWGNGGFDPKDTRVYTRGRNKAKLNAALKESQANTASVEG